MEGCEHNLTRPTVGRGKAYPSSSPCRNVAIRGLRDRVARMKFSKLADFMERLEATSKRLEMIDILKDLLLEASEEEIGPICFMLLGSLAPDYEGVEIGMAEKLVMRSVAKVAGVGELEADRRLKKTGDMGKAAAQLLSAK